MVNEVKHLQWETTGYENKVCIVYTDFIYYSKIKNKTSIQKKYIQ